QVNLLGGSETAAIDLFLDPADSVTEMATPNQLSPSDLKPSGAKLKELQEQLVALTIENEALKAQRLETEQLRLKTESETVQLLRRQLAEERAARGCSEEAPVAAAQRLDERPHLSLDFVRRNNAAVRAAAASDSTADAATGEKDDAAEADDEKDDKEDDKGIAMSLDAAADGGLLDRMKNWAVGGLLSLLEDMQVPTEAERQAAAADDQLSARRLKVNCTRFGRSTQPIFASIKGFVHVVRWKSPSYTVLVMLVYYCALLNNYLLPMILLLCIVRLLLNYFKYRLGWDLEFNFLAEYEDSDGEENSGGAEKERTVGTQVNFVVHVAKKVQLLLNALLVAFVLSMLIPTTAYLFYVGFYLGIKLFVIDPIFAKYPRLRRKYDSVDKIWRTLPTDQQVGYHQTNKDVEKYILPYTEEDQICSPESRPENRSPLCSDDEEFCQVFALPNLECPLVRWKGGKRCAIICKEADKALPDSLKHGKLFLTRSFLCFERGKDRGKVKKRNITKPFAWLPGGGMAIEVQIRGMEKAITFGAIIGRDELFDSIMETGRRVSLPWSAPAASTAGSASASIGGGDSPTSIEAAAVAAEELVTLDLDLVQSVHQALLSDSDSDD
uniref:GRAM domain-containing protein n=1 Tax=Macrostomum lignano TaxID=282301 RepID=A0A1I8GXZ0_9PLAT